MDQFYNLNMPKVRKDVIQFYERNQIDKRRWRKGHNSKRLLDITISIDGSFYHVWRDATHCASLAVEVYTGRPVDAVMTTKCTSCEKCNDYKDNGNCKFDLFHGCSGDMEKYNAIVLFGRSMSIGFRYTSYIADGDCKNHKAITELAPYGKGVIILKGECANHLSKNESIHSKIWNICHKLKMHRQDRFVFALQQVMLSHNFGHIKASLLNVLGTMSPEVSHNLDLLDREAICVSKIKHELHEQCQCDLQ